MRHRYAASGFLFVVSGFSALVYEVLWERSLRLSFGVSTYSVAIITAAFMGGLSGGYWWGRSRGLARFHPLRVYAAAEAGIALYALAFPVLIVPIEFGHRAAEGALWVRAALAVIVLLVPTSLMGITLPVVTRWLSGESGPGRPTGWLYAANATGAIIGALGAGWFFLRLYGAAATNEFAVAINLGIAGLALAVSLVTPGEPAEARVRRTQAAPVIAGASLRSGALTAAAFSAGLQTMALQVIWNRTLVCVVENNTTSFALILAGVLIGTAAGAWMYALVGKRAGDPRRGVAVFVGVEIFLALAVVASVPVLNRLYDLARALEAVLPIRGVATLCLVRLLVILGPVGLPAAAGAFLLPLLVDLGSRESDRARPVSRVFAADALGSVAGALGAGFGLIPTLGLSRSLTATAGLALATAVVLAIVRGSKGRVKVVAAAAVTAAAVFAFAQPLTLTRWYDGHQGIRGEILLYREGMFGTISVFRVENRKELLINCIEEVPNHRDALLLFKLLGHVPLLFDGAPREVLVNALGGGITLGAVLRHGAGAEAVELVPEVREAMALFGEENGGALERRDWRFIHDDGRNYLRLSRRKYDVITADATHPAAGESWPLYTQEYYAIVRDHLASDGFFAQWLPLHNMVDRDFLSSLATFHSSFPEMLVLFVQRYCILLGSLAPIHVSPEMLSSRIAAKPEVAADLRSLGISGGRDLLKYVVLDGNAVGALTAGVDVMTDDNAAVEFAELHRIGISETFPLNLALLARAMDPAALQALTGLDAVVFRARQRLLEVQLQVREPTLESAFAAIRDIEAARDSIPRDADFETALDSLQGTVVRHLAREYEELLSRPDSARVLEILVYAQRKRPDDPFLNELLGAALLRIESFEEAILYLDRAAAIRPQDVTYQSNLAYAYEQTGRNEEALEILKRIELLDPDDSAIRRVRERVERRLAEKRGRP